MGIFESMYRRCSSETRTSIGVAITAGVTQFTKTPVPATSFARAFVRPMTPAFEAEHAAAFGLGLASPMATAKDRLVGNWTVIEPCYSDRLGPVLNSKRLDS